MNSFRYFGGDFCLQGCAGDAGSQQTDAAVPRDSFFAWKTSSENKFRSPYISPQNRPPGPPGTHIEAKVGYEIVCCSSLDRNGDAKVDEVLELILDFFLADIVH